ncbi:MAG TPA: ABC transporter ATP-binding protein [Anaerolineales bacterium]|nr:ABC transporter ATP-binding protein [Anaerolineales bacterium]
MSGFPVSIPTSKTLTIKDISKQFAGLRALDGVSLDLRPGEILGLIGPNGSGKTTLINVVTGLIPPTGGQVFVDGLEITGKKPFHIARAGLARTFQTIRLFRELTVLENVEVAAVSIGLSRQQARDLALVILEEIGVLRWADIRAGVLPYGLERRVEVARALATRPKFLFLDEPAAGLNEEESEDLLRILALMPQQKDLGMLIVDHDMHLIMRLCHRLHVLNYGKTIGEGTPEEVRKIPAVIQAYLGKTAVGG